MSADTLFIFGLGGHAKVVLSEALLSDNYSDIIFFSEKSFTDDNISFDDISYRVINSLDTLKDLYNDYKHQKIYNYFQYIFLLILC